MPNGNLIYKRGEIWWIELDPATGVEAKKTRACLILQNDLGNKQSSLTIVVPFLATRNYPFVVNVKPTSLNNLDRERGLHFSQIRAVDCSRIKSKIGILEDDYWQEIVKAIAIQLQLQDFFKD
ncbi:MAG: type II toxin-antitoxin system PemK/MazF family toxin [Cyanobacteria bacterium P01_E01_bin.35]